MKLNNPEIEALSYEVINELNTAIDKFDRMHSAHEGYAVILEEVEELWDEVKNRKNSKDRMREEAIQVAAMAMRFILDVCDRMDK